MNRLQSMLRPVFQNATTFFRIRVARRPGADVRWFAIVLGLLSAAFPAHAQEPSPAHPMVVDTVNREVRVFAEFQPDVWSGIFKGTSRYHAVVWKKGRAAGEALFRAEVDDRTFYQAMVQLGARPGNSLSEQSWSRRNDPASSEPDRHAEGTPVFMAVRFAGSPPVPLDSLLEDPGGRGIDLRFAGNLALIPRWKSGCIVCLYSCPGGKVSNAAYTIRDYVRGTTRFALRPRFRSMAPQPVILIFRVQPSGGG